MANGNQLPPAGETACLTYFAKRLIQQGGAGGFACRSNGHNQRSASKMNKFPKTVRRRPAATAIARHDRNAPYSSASWNRRCPVLAHATARAIISSQILCCSI